MAYFFFTKDILKGKPIPIFELCNHGIVARDFTNIDDIVRVVQRNGDVPFTRANISLARRGFGYKPTTDLQMGLKKFVRWYEKYYGSGKW
ncbi:putative UDP-glucuronate 4-epimerase [Helianthus anomalus]